jgi:integrase
MKLTKRVIDGLGPVTRDTFYWDDDLPGFGLRCRPSGKRTFVVQFRVGGGRGGKLRRMNLGAYGFLTLDQARAQAKRHLAKASLGEDPGQIREEKRKIVTVNQLLEIWEREGVITNRRTGAPRAAHNIAGELGMVEAHIRPLLGKLELPKLTKADIEKARRAIATGATATTKPGRLRGRIRVVGGEGTATRTIRLLSSILSFAEDRGMISANPARGVKLAPGRKLNRFLSPDEIRRLGVVLRAPQPTLGMETAAKAIELLMLTGARRQEIVGLRWHEVDLTFGVLRLEASKTGAKIVPLASTAVARLEAIRAEPDADPVWVFPNARGDGPYKGIGRAWDRFREQAGLSGVRLHDLRHTFASVGAGQGVGLTLIGGILGHSQASTTQRYAHLADDPLRRAVETIAGDIAAKLEQ